MNQTTQTQQKQKGPTLAGIVSPKGKIRLNLTKGANGKPIRLLGGFTLLSNGVPYDLTINGKTDEDVKAKAAALEKTVGNKSVFILVPNVRVREETVSKDGRVFTNRRARVGANQVLIMPRKKPAPAAMAAAA